jgi:glutamine amidotransferase
VEKGPGERGYIVATKKLTNERWQEFKLGELIVFKDGEMVYSSTDREPGTGRPR